MESQDFQIQCSDQDLGKRLDVVVMAHSTGVSRSSVQLLMCNQAVQIEGKVCRKPSTLMKPGQSIFVQLSKLETLKPETIQAEDIPLDILFEDDAIIVLNKPAGMVVHPAKGHWSGTLTAGLVFHFEKLSSVGGAHRPGIVHRLDRDTTGVIVVAKTDQAHTNLMRQFEQRTVEKTYLAIVTPCPDRDRDRIEASIGAHPYQREKKAIREGHATSKAARTFYEVQAQHGRFGILAVKPKTGRTHQIRVHMAHVGCPILADRLYGGRAKVTEGWLRQGVDQGEILLNRQALHAWKIAFQHPLTNERLEVEAPLPEDLKKLMAWLKNEF